MNKKLIISCLALAIAVWSTAAYAAPGPPKVIGTWDPERVSDANGDGWCDWAGSQPLIGPFPKTISGRTYAQSTIGATHGSGSLAVTQNGWGQSLAIHNYQCQVSTGFYMSDLFNNDKFEIDVTYDSASWPSNTSYAQVYELTMQTATYGGQNVGGTNDPTGAKGVKFTDTLNPGYPGGLPVVDPGTTLHKWTGTWIWDYSAILPGGSYTGTKIAATDSWVNFYFALNSNQQGTYYFDNARLVPEPATIALLSLGGLALLRRKRA